MASHRACFYWGIGKLPVKKPTLYSGKYFRVDVSTAEIIGIFNLARRGTPSVNIETLEKRLTRPAQARVYTAHHPSANISLCIETFKTQLT